MVLDKIFVYKHRILCGLTVLGIIFYVLEYNQAYLWSLKTRETTEITYFLQTSPTTSTFQVTKTKINKKNKASLSTRNDKHVMLQNKKVSLKVNNKDKSKNRTRKTTVYVNMYNPHDSLMPNDPFHDCEANIQCQLLKGREYFKNTSYVMFTGSHLDFDPPAKVQGQTWIFYSLEPPVYHKSNLSKWKNLFNWTMTYRRDSDIPYFYGMFQRKTKKSNQSKKASNVNFSKLSNIWKSNASTSAWFVSRCVSHSERERYVRFLQKYLSVHVYGRCGKLSCPRASANACFDKLDKSYAFYLSLENSFCRDYITEKSFKMYLKQINIIPIVRGMLPGQYKMFLPPKSFIDTSSYQSVPTLGKDVKFVMGNQTEYLSYFHWRENYQSVQNWRNIKTGFCDLCRKFHKPNIHVKKYSKLYEDISKFMKGNKSFPVCIKNTQDIH